MGSFWVLEDFFDFFDPVSRQNTFLGGVDVLDFVPKTNFPFWCFGGFFSYSSLDNLVQISQKSLTTNKPQGPLKSLLFLWLLCFVEGQFANSKIFQHVKLF